MHSGLVTRASGIIGHWPLDGSHVVGTLAKDISRYSNDGTITVGAGGLTTGIYGQSNGAYDFDGTATTILNDPYNATKNITNNFTLAVWISPDTTHEIDTEANSGTTGLSGQRYALAPYNMAAIIDAAHSGAGISAGTNGVSVYEWGSSYVPPLLVYAATISGWTHATVVYINQQPRLYLNGIWVRTGLTSTKVVHPRFQIGSFAGYGSFDGKSYDVRAYSYAMSAAQVANLYQSYGV